MVFATDERSIQDGAPIELFKFIGTYSTYRLTNHGRPITNTDGTYESGFAISRSDAEGGTQDEDLEIDIDIDPSHPMIAEYVINEPPPGLRLQIFRVHPNDLDDTYLLWDGEGVSWSVQATPRSRVAKLRVPSLFSFLFDGPVPRPKYQSPCNHILGDARCGVDLTSAANSHDTTITAISGNTITLASNPFPDGEVNAGQMIAPSERRMVIANTGLTFTIASPFSPAVSVSDAVTIRRGCDHALNGDCVNRFDNAINFGGFPLVPDRNPFDSRL